MSINNNPSSTPTKPRNTESRNSYSHNTESYVKAIVPQQQFAKLASGQLTLAQLQPSNSSRQDAVKKVTKKRPLWRRVIGLPAYHWILLAQFFVIVPHVVYLPVWLIGFGVVSIAAQLPRVKATSFASKRVYLVIQLIGFIAGVLGLWLTYGLNLGIDVGVAFLLLCLICKLWELYKRRDAYVVLNLSLFVLAALFLMDQGLATTLQVLLGSSTVLLAFIAMNDESNLQGAGRLRSFALLVGQALPLMIILFLFFPRLPPLWSLHLSGQQATTGVSDSMSPGDFANLSQSTALAFRAEFTTAIPPQPQLYWRGLVFSDFDGVTWTPNRQAETWYGRSPMPQWLQSSLSTVPQQQLNNPQSYQITLEPTQQRWLFGLDYPFSRQDRLGITSNFTLYRYEPVSQQLRYPVERFESMQIDTQLSDALRQVNLTLPSSGNLKSREYAQTLYSQVGGDVPRYIEAIRNWITTDNFRYTLSPPRLQDNRIDEFLFDTKAGFCEHYSSSFTFLMRAAGIPARVVAGYQGGELGRDGVSWEVRQMDAHAWSEVWIEGRGWVRVDPTSFVAPERVEEGMDALTEQRGASMFGTGAGAQFSYQQFKMLQSLRRLSDQASYYWQRDIVGYDQEKQRSSLFKWFNIKSFFQQMLWMLLGLGLVMAVVVFGIWYRRRKQWHAADLVIIQLSKRMAKYDPALSIGSEEGILDWLTRLEASADSKEALTALRQVKADYRQLRYGKLSASASTADYQKALHTLKSHSKEIR